MIVVPLTGNAEVKVVLVVVLMWLNTCWPLVAIKQ